MTKADKPVKRETYSSYRGRPLIIEIHPTFMRIRTKKSQTYYTVTYDQLWTLGARNQAEARRKEKKTKKKGLVT